MRRFLLATMLLIAPSAVAQQSVILTLEDALDRARGSAPTIVAARMRIEQTRGRVVGASLLFWMNPSWLTTSRPFDGLPRLRSPYGVKAAQGVDLLQSRPQPDQRSTRSGDAGRAQRALLIDNGFDHVHELV